MIDHGTMKEDSAGMVAPSPARYEFTYIKDHGTPSEMIGQALDQIEGWADRNIAAEAEQAGNSGVHAMLRRLSLKEKLDVLIPEGVERLDNECGERAIWQEVHDLIELRPDLAGDDAHARLMAWLDREGWYDPSLDIPQASEPLRSEIILRILLDGLLIYLDGWFSELAKA